MAKVDKNKNLQKIDKEILNTNPTLESIDPELRQELIKTAISVVSVSRVHSGPLPDVETLAGYDKIIKNGAERLMQQVELQSAHRRKIENWYNIQSLLGQLFGLVIAGSVLYASYQLAIKGNEAVAKVLGDSTKVGIKGIFVYGKRKQNEESNQ